MTNHQRKLIKRNDQSGIIYELMRLERRIERYEASGNFHPLRRLSAQYCRLERELDQ